MWHWSMYQMCFIHVRIDISLTVRVRYKVQQQWSDGTINNVISLYGKPNRHKHIRTIKQLTKAYFINVICNLWHPINCQEKCKTIRYLKLLIKCLTRWLVKDGMLHMQIMSPLLPDSGLSQPCSQTNNLQQQWI